MADFIDEATIDVAAGNGGDGRVGFRREKFVPRGGPDGGDGGRGGDVVLVAERNLATLMDHRYQRKFEAGHGEPGGTNQRSGSDGADVVVRVPVGTTVFDASADGAEPLCDLVADGQRYVAARGGRGGWGNQHFATPTRQTPEFAKPGLPGTRARLRLSLKLLADVGLVGLPNAGKSTLLSRISAARPKVAPYPFTTLVPGLGVAQSGERRFVVADIPGLIGGASQGVGLGDRFLRHIERTRILVHLLDVGSALLEERDPLAEYETVRGELAAYGAGLEDRPEIVVLNKLDLVADRAATAPLAAELERRGRTVLPLSGATGEGVPQLLARLVWLLEALEKQP
jgi:GTP-binding protein